MAYPIDTSSVWNNLSQSVLISIVCMGIVFLMLTLLWGIVALFKYLPEKKEKAACEETGVPVMQAPSTNKIKFEDIKDDDMMAAALVCSIDYHEETKKDVRVVSVKEI